MPQRRPDSQAPLLQFHPDHPVRRLKTEIGKWNFSRKGYISSYGASSRRPCSQQLKVVQAGGELENGVLRRCVFV